MTGNRAIFPLETEEDARFFISPDKAACRGDIRSCSSGVERVLGKDEVAGSNPARSSIPQQATI